MRRNTVTTMCLTLGVLIAAHSNADAGILVYIDPPITIADIGDGTVTVDLRADIPANEAIAGWGLDLTTVGTSASFIGVDSIATPFDAPGSPDGDGLAGLVPPTFNLGCLSGEGVLLATLTFSIDDFGDTDVILSDDNPLDLTEGFALCEPEQPGGFAEVTYQDGLISVPVPEPASICLLALGGVMFLPRRRR